MKYSIEILCHQIDFITVSTPKALSPSSETLAGLARFTRDTVEETQKRMSGSPRLPYSPKPIKIIISPFSSSHPDRIDTQIQFQPRKILLQVPADELESTIKGVPRIEVYQTMGVTAALVEARQRNPLMTVPEEQAILGIAEGVTVDLLREFGEESGRRHEPENLGCTVIKSNSFSFSSGSSCRDSFEHQGLI